jgi:hypothetical protein
LEIKCKLFFNDKGALESPPETKLGIVIKRGKDKNIISTQYRIALLSCNIDLNSLVNRKRMALTKQVFFSFCS